MRPYATLRAEGAPPTPSLTLAESAVLRRLEDGEAIAIASADLPMSMAIRLAAIGRIQITDGHAALFDPKELPF